MSYEWRAKSVMGEPTQCAIEGMTKDGWRFVPASRHDGLFIPVGYNGVIDVGGQVLMERPKSYTDAANVDRVAKAHKQVDDWAKKYGGLGISGGVRVWTGDENAPPPFKQVGELAAASNVISNMPQRLGAPTTAAASPAAAPCVPVRKPRHRYLRWIFDLISTEQ